MKITKYLTVVAVALFVFTGMSACNKNTDPKNSAANQPAANNAANSNPAAANKPEAPPASETSLSSTNSLATPTAAYKVFYTAHQKKDIEGLKKVLSKDMLDFLTDVAKSDGQTLNDSLKFLVSTSQASTAETRNEKISGDTATLEYLDETGDWQTMDFIKEGSDWKLTIPKDGKKDSSTLTMPKNVKKDSDDKKKDTNTKK